MLHKNDAEDVKNSKVRLFKLCKQGNVNNR